MGLADFSSANHESVHFKRLYNDYRATLDSWKGTTCISSKDGKAQISTTEKVQAT